MRKGVDQLIPGVAEDKRLLPDTVRRQLSIRSSKGKPVLANFAKHILDNALLGKYDDELRYFKDQVVVDLGPGSFPSGYQLSVIGEAKAYIGVEPYYANGLVKSLEEVKTPIPYSVVPEKMLRFLRKLPEDSVSMLTVGIDGAVMGSSVFDPRFYSIFQQCYTSKKGDASRYVKKVEDEMERVLHPEGAYIKNWSCFNPDLERKIEGNDLLKLTVFTKPSSQPNTNNTAN